ncbi:NADP-dependent oxidoreductase [Micromonospora sp. CA-259024]|uniref:NADP-dependent oxidoreductase n=1 Tax=Micromonospora sp. CA-259024 TaxID=3239965 RepID=UPI003D908A83
MTDPAAPVPGEPSDPKLMRAAIVERFGGPEVLRLVHLPRPTPKPGHVLVRVHAASVNYGETKIRKGLVPELGPPPHTLGSDLSGTVMNAHPSTHRFKAGDEVYGIHFIGTYAEYVSVPELSLAAKPTTLDHVHAAALPVAAQTALIAIFDYATLRPRQQILIHAAAGGVGHLAVQLAKLRGAHVTGTARQEKHTFLRGMGADELIDYTQVDFTRVARNVDVVLDLIGGTYGRRSLDCLRPGGLVLGAALEPGLTDAEAHRRGMRYRWLGGTSIDRPLDRIRDLVDTGQLRVHVDRTYTLEELPAAHAYADSGRVTGKLVLTIRSSGAAGTNPGLERPSSDARTGGE